MMRTRTRKLATARLEFSADHRLRTGLHFAALTAFIVLAIAVGGRLYADGRAPRAKLAELRQQNAALRAGLARMRTELELERSTRAALAGQVGNVLSKEDARGLLVLSEKGRIAGNVQVHDAVVNGTICGDLEVENFVELQVNARVTGAIKYRTLQMECGARHLAGARDESHRSRSGTQGRVGTARVAHDVQGSSRRPVVQPFPAGSRRRGSVVDKYHRAHDIPNLFVCDGSSFVTSGRGQPTMTIQALAFRAGDGTDADCETFRPVAISTHRRHDHSRAEAPMNVIRTSHAAIVVAAATCALLTAAVAQESASAAATPAEQALAIKQDDAKLQWSPCPPLFPQGCQIAVLHGDPSKPNADVFFRVPGGYAIPAHWHTSAEHMILVSGEFEVRYEGQPSVTLQKGDYAFGPSRAPHEARCLSQEPCTLFIAFETAVDAHPVTDQPL